MYWFVFILLFYSSFFLFVMNLKLFLSQRNIIDRELGNFYLLILLVCKVRLNCWFLILKMRFDFFENLFRVNCLCFVIIFLFSVCRFVRMYPTVCV